RNKVAVPEGAAGTPPFWSFRIPYRGHTRYRSPCAAVEIMFRYRSYVPGGRSKERKNDAGT
ncbi:hypothetical protein, partial [Parabacteroides sp. AF27-14]|uniref:hypothetical protein n=1 Tax=Parabacteroides sp. AF27-14 TaxID=2293116 RepID=UPI001F32217E